MSLHTRTFAHFASAIETLCHYFNGSLISGIRTQKHNRDLGGHTTSLHLVGLAADIQFDSPADQDRAIRWATRNGLFFKPKSPTACHFQALPPLNDNAA